MPGALGIYEMAVISSLKVLGKTNPESILAASAFILHSFYLVITFALGLPCFFLSRPDLGRLRQKIKELMGK